jgi:hypothetical protein
MQKIKDKVAKNLATQQQVFQTLYLIREPIVRLIGF